MEHLSNFGECNWPPGLGTPAVFQPHELINLLLIAGVMRVEVDLYSQRIGGDSNAFNVDLWESEKLVIELSPGRANWKRAHSSARSALRNKAFARSLKLNPLPERG